MDHTETDIATVETLNQVMRWWWLLAILGILGAFIGVAFSASNVPVYESHREIGVSIDLTRTGDLSDSDEDRLMQNVVGRVLQPDLTSPLSAKLHQPEAYWAERFQYAITLRVRAASPDEAQALVDQWTLNAVIALNEAAGEASKTAALQSAMNDLTVCIQQSVALPNGSPLCEALPLTEWESRINTLSTQVSESRLQDYGLTPGMSFIAQASSTSAVRVTTSIGISGLAGGMLGLLFGYVLLSTGWISKRQKVNQRA